MKNQKQFAASALLISLLLVSCDSGKALNNAVTGTGGGTTPEEGETTVEELTDGLENINYGGAKFNIVYSVDQLGAAWPYDAETEKGDRLNDSVYKRNHTVEDRFNVDINYVSTGGVMNEVPQALMKSVRSGDTDYHLAISHTYASVPTMLSEGCLADFLAMPNIDLSKPWWNASITRQ